MNVIALTGPQAVGKTTTAQIMKTVIESEYNCKAAVFSFADSLRYFTSDVFGQEYIAASKDRNLKDAPMVDLFIKFFGIKIDSDISPRQVLVKLGESMRARFGKDIFCTALGNTIEASDADYAIIDDLRKENELNWLRYTYGQRDNHSLMVLALNREDVPNSYDFGDVADFLDFPLVDKIETLASCENPYYNKHNYETINSILVTYHG